MMQPTKTELTQLESESRRANARARAALSVAQNARNLNSPNTHDLAAFAQRRVLEAWNRRAKLREARRAAGLCLACGLPSLTLFCEACDLAEVRKHQRAAAPRPAAHNRHKLA